MGKIKKGIGMYRKCKKRIAKNEFGENMCGAIACCEIGDMFCECPECRKECDKEYALECFSVHCIDSNGLEYDRKTASANTCASAVG